MSDNQTKEVSPEQQIKNLEYKIERMTRVLESANEALTDMQNDLSSKLKYTICPQIDSLNNQLVEITSKIIQGDSVGSELAIKQAYFTGQLQTLNNYSNSIMDISRKLNTLIITTNNKN